MVYKRDQKVLGNFGAGTVAGLIWANEQRSERRVLPLRLCPDSR